jgi:hypothetical protein
MLSFPGCRTKGLSPPSLEQRPQKPRTKDTKGPTPRRITSPEESWWRPGMTGVAKIDAGHRRLLWILTRRFIDMLRMKLWI